MGQAELNNRNHSSNCRRYFRKRRPRKRRPEDPLRKRRPLRNRRSITKTKTLTKTKTPFENEDPLRKRNPLIFNQRETKNRQSNIMARRYLNGHLKVTQNCVLKLPFTAVIRTGSKGLWIHSPSICFFI